MTHTVLPHPLRFSITSPPLLSLPCASVVSHCNPTMTSSCLHYLYLRGKTLGMYLWISSSLCRLCVSFVWTLVCVCPCCRENPSSLIWLRVHSGTICATSPLPAATGSGRFFTDERRGEAHCVLHGPDLPCCQTWSMETEQTVTRFMLWHITSVGHGKQF